MRILACCLLACLALALGACSPLAVDTDISQERLNRATAPLDRFCGTGQTFRATRPNLTAIAVLLVVYGDAPLDQGASLTLHLRAHPAADDDLQQVEVSLWGKRHNDLVRFELQPIADSDGQGYYFCLETNAPDRVAVWHNTLDAYADGDMYEGGTRQPGDLRFTTYANYALPQVLQHVAGTLQQHSWPLLAACLLLYLPGQVLLRLLAPPGQSQTAELGPRWILAICLTLAVLPLLTLWTSTLHIALSPRSAAVFLALLAGIEAWSIWRSGPSVRRAALRQALTPAALALGLILCLTLVVRLVQIRGLVLPVWVDSVHQTLIARLIAEQGLIPSSYEPLLPVSDFYRHFGFHALAAWYHWLSGLPVPQAVLALGQILNAAAILPAYLLALRLTRHPMAGLVAAAITGLISIMPAYYASWGRYTQLAGMVILPASLALLYHTLSEPLKNPRLLTLSAIAAAGLFVTH